MAHYADLQNVMVDGKPQDLLATLVYQTDIDDLIKTEVNSPAPANVCSELILFIYCLLVMI